MSKTVARIPAAHVQRALGKTAQAKDDEGQVKHPLAPHVARAVAGIAQSKKSDESKKLPPALHVQIATRGAMPKASALDRRQAGLEPIAQSPRGATHPAESSRFPPVAQAMLKKLTKEQQKAKDKERRAREEKARAEASAKAREKNAATPEARDEERKRIAKAEAAQIRERKAQEEAARTRALLGTASTKASMSCEMTINGKAYRGTSGHRGDNQGNIPDAVWSKITRQRDLEPGDRDQDCFGTNCAEIECIHKFFDDVARPDDSLRGAVFKAFNSNGPRGPCRTCKKTIEAISATAEW